MGGCIKGGELMVMLMLSTAPRVMTVFISTMILDILNKPYLCFSMVGVGDAQPLLTACYL
jgi:hypothetical protein